MQHKFLFLTLFVLISLIIPQGCGYHFRETGKPIGVQIQSLAIPLMESTSSSLGFEGVFTRMIREEFVSHARVPIVSRDEAATVLIGRVSEIKTEPYTYRVDRNTVGGRKTTYEVTNARWLRVKLDARLVERPSGKIIWAERGMEERTTFSVGTDPLENRYNQDQALRRIARSLAERIYLKTMERF